MSDLPDPTDENAPAIPAQKTPADPHGKKVSVPGALFSGAFNAGLIALIAAIPSFGLPFILPGFAAITLPMMAGPAVAIIGAFMRLGYVTNMTRRLTGMLEHAAGAWSSWAVWTFYPLALSTLGVPPMVDTVVKFAFGAFAILHAIGFFRDLVGLLRGERPSRNHLKRLERLDKFTKRQKREQDAFFEDD